MTSIVYPGVVRGGVLTHLLTWGVTLGQIGVAGIMTLDALSGYFLYLLLLLLLLLLLMMVFILRIGKMQFFPCAAVSNIEEQEHVSLSSPLDIPSH